jgi:hypothetical protein
MNEALKVDRCGGLEKVGGPEDACPEDGNVLTVSGGVTGGECRMKEDVGPNLSYRRPESRKVVQIDPMEDKARQHICKPPRSAPGPDEGVNDGILPEEGPHQIGADESCSPRDKNTFSFDPIHTQSSAGHHIRSIILLPCFSTQTVLRTARESPGPTDL